MSKKKSPIPTTASPAAFYRLTDDMLIANRWHLDEVVDKGGRPPDFLGGERYEGTSLSTKVHAGSTPLDFSLTSFAVPVLRTKLAQAMVAVAPQSIQLVRLEIPGHKGFDVLNVLDSIDGLHEGNSNFEDVKSDGGRRQYIGVAHIVLDRSKLRPDAHIFRLRGWETAIYISETMKAAMESADCIGAAFSFN